MSLLRRVYMWLVAILRPDRLENDLDREMRFHLDMEIEANVRRGMSPGEAHRVAMIAFGGVERHKESARDERGTRFIGGAVTDMRFALRRLRTHRGFSFLVTGTLAIGIGATTAVYSYANWVLYRPVPGVVAPDELVTVSFEDGPGQPTGISYPTLVEIRDLPAFSGIASAATGPRYQVGGESASPRTVVGAVVAGDYFGVLGVRPSAGRLLAPEELTPSSGSRAAVVSEALAASMFGSRHDAVGKPIRVNAVDFTIVGVVGRGFRGTERVGTTDLWLPNAAYGELRHRPGYDVSGRTARAFFTTIGRLRPGATLSVAQSQLRRVVARLADQFPSDYKVYESHPPTLYADIGTNVLGRAESRRTMRLMLGITGLALLIACANVAHLLLFRGLTRRPEMAVRRALGASASQLLRQHVAEGLSIGVIGAVGGVAVALGLRTLFEGQRILAGEVVENVGLDARVFWFVAALAALTGLAFGVVPAISALADDQFRALRDAGRRGSERRSLLHSGLAVGQIAASLSLIVGALLLARTLTELRRVELGFDPTNVYTFPLEPEPQGLGRAQVRSLRDDIVARLRNRPGIETVAAALEVPFTGASYETGFRLAATSAPDWTLEAELMSVSAGYFRTLRISLLAGRDFTDTELGGAQRESMMPVVLNQAAARRLFGDRDPLGEIIHERDFKAVMPRVVVGIVGDTRNGDLRSTPEPIVYGPVETAYRPAMTIIVRSARSAHDIQALVEATVAALAPTLPVPRGVALQELVDGAMADERIFLRLVGLLAMITAVLAGVGLYALLAFDVAARTREIGIRMALGARTTTVVSNVTRQGGRLLVVGAGAGMALAAVATKVLESRLFGVARLDPSTYAGALLALVATGALALALPARRAARVDPVRALRSDG
jgi:predicted permease